MTGAIIDIAWARAARAEVARRKAGQKRQARKAADRRPTLGEILGDEGPSGGGAA